MGDGRQGVFEGGIYRLGDVRLSDLSGNKMLPVGNSNFATVVRNSVYVDKSMLIADVLDGGNLATLFCRPRRFGKSLNLSMIQRFFEIPPAPLPVGERALDLFEGLAIWDAGGGRYRAHCEAYPVVRLSFNNVKGADWPTALGVLEQSIVAEFRRHGYLGQSPALLDAEKEQFARALRAEMSQTELLSSLVFLTGLLYRHHGARAVVLIDEYDAPVMAGYAHGYYGEVVGFLKGWLTGALKDSDALAFAVLTGVQRISKESIFSDLNNLTVNTSLNVVSDERYGFTDEEVWALADYLGFPQAIADARRWYDGYRFGSVDAYNPWSVLNYLNNGCVPDVYWGNTSDNGIVGDLVRHADPDEFDRVRQLLAPGGVVRAPLDLGVVFPEIGVRGGRPVVHALPGRLPDD